jgi:hypothetical protein
VDVIFAFKNSMMINTLIKRGQYIMNSKNKELIEIEHQLNKTFEEQGDELSEPVRAYIIFQDEEGYQRAIHLTKQTICCRDSAEMEWHGKPLYFKAAPEPSNIMWENQYWPRSVKLMRKLATLLIVILILTV